MDVGAIFVDGGNMSRALTARARPGTRPLIDYGRLIERLQWKLQVALPFKLYYTAHRDEKAAERRAFFYRHLKDAGWTVWTMSSRLGDDGIWRDKGLDLAMGLDAWALVLRKQVRTLVVATHDGDFAELFRRAKAEGVRTVVVGWRASISLDIADHAEAVFLEDLEVVRG